MGKKYYRYNHDDGHIAFATSDSNLSGFEEGLTEITIEEYIIGLLDHVIESQKKTISILRGLEQR